MYVTRYPVLTIVYLCLIVKLQLTAVEAACECVPGQCSPDQSDDGQCIYEQNKLKYFCCISSDNGSVDCDCRDECKVDKHHVQQGICASSITVGRRCCW